MPHQKICRKWSRKIDIHSFARIFRRAMHCRLFALAILSPITFTFAADSPSPSVPPAQFKYPPAPISNQVDDYNGVKVADPYRPLENPDSPESRKWIEEENKITFDFLKTIPERDGIKKRLT